MVMRILFILLAVMAVQDLSAQRGIKVPQTLDSLEWFLKTKEVDTTYAAAMKDCAFEYIIQGKYESADSLRRKIEELNSQWKNFRLYYYVPFLQATLDYHQNNQRGCLDNFLKALRVVQANRSRFTPKTQEAALSNVSAGYSRIQKQDSSIYYALQAVRVQEENHFTNSSTYIKLGDALSKFGRYTQALPYLEKGLKISIQDKNLIGTAVAESKLGTLYHYMKKNKEAIEYYKSGLAHAEEADYALLQTDFLVNLGLMSVGEKHYNEAKQYFLKGEKLCRALDNKGALKTNLHNQGELYRELRDFKTAEKYYLEAYAIAREFDDKPNLYVAQKALAELYIDSKDYQQACDFLILAEVSKDSVFQSKTSDKVQELLATYESEKKQQQIELLNQQNLVQQLQLSVKRRNEILLIVAMVAIAVITIIAYRRYRLKSQLALEKVRSNIAADFHDELGANLSSIALYSDILMQNNDIETHTKPLLKNINQNARQTLSSISDLIWSINPDNDILEVTLIRMKEFSIPLMEAHNIDFAFDIDEHVRNMRLDMTARKIIYLVFKEAINNALKYAEASRINVVLKRVDKTIILTIQDNGKGFDSALQRRGNGLNNMRKRAAEIDGNLSIESSVSQGCMVTLSFRSL